VISEDIDTLDLVFFGTSFVDDLRDSTIMVESGQTGDVLLLHSWSIVAQNEGICVGGIGNYHTFHIWACIFKGMGLFQEDHLVKIEQIFSFHALLARLSSDKDDDVSTFEHLVGFVSELNLSF
jgi:hypothetical protein